jgi:hypothetical protein
MVESFLAGKEKEPEAVAAVSGFTLTQPTLGLPEWGAQSLASFYPVNEIPLARFHLWNLVHNKTRQNGGRRRQPPFAAFYPA